MTFIMKKKKYKFNIDFFLDELNCVPFINALLFAKIRLLDGGSFTQTTSRNEVIDHSVRWKSKYSFVCKMTANASSGILDSCLMRISIRKEEKGGRTFQKLGFVDIDLAQFAGCGLTTRRYLLEGYNDKKHRQDNSTLKLQVGCTLLSGDPLFKRPSKTNANLHVPSYGSASNSKDNTMNSQLDPNDLAVETPLHEPKALVENNNLVSCSDHNDPLSRHSTLKSNLLLSGKTLPLKFNSGLMLEDAIANGLGGGSTNAKQGEESGESVSSGFGSLPRYKHEQQPNSVQGKDSEITEEIKGIEFISSKSGDNTTTHSRQSSGEEPLIVDQSIFESNERLKQLHQSTLPLNSQMFKQSKPHYATLQPSQQKLLRSRMDTNDNLNNKVDATRMDCEDIVNEIIESQLRENDCSLSQEPEFRLELFVAEDGTAKLGSKAITRTRKACSSKPTTDLFTSHSSPNSRPNSSIEILRPENV